MRKEKTLLLKEIQDKIQNSQAIVFARYAKMNPNLASSFRMNILKVGGNFEVVKKRMLIKAAADQGFSLDRTDLEGHIGIIFAEQDPVQTAKYVYQFKKENDGVLEVLGGRFEGKICSEPDVKLISELPSQDDMRAQLLGLFEAPMSQSLAVIEALLCSPIHCLENKVKIVEESENQASS